MSEKNTGVFQIKSWDEKPFKEAEDGIKLTHAHVTQAYEGVLSGESIVEYIMTYCSDGSANFVGMEFFTGKIGSLSGSAVFQHSGTFEGGTAKSSWVVVEGAGSEGLSDLQGSGSCSAAHGEEASYRFEHSLK